MQNKTVSRKKAVHILRRAIQVVCFFLLPSLFLQIFNSLKAVFLFLVHGQGTFAAAVPNLIVLVAATAVTAVAGRFFCGWMCAFGSMGDFLYRIPRLGKKNPRRYLTGADAALKWVKYVLLAAIVVLVWGFQLVSLPSGTNPWDLFGMLVSFGSLPSLATLASGWVPAAVILLAIMLASVLVERFFCRYLCPLGAYFSLISRFRPLAIAKDRKSCGRCSLCTRKCAMGIALGGMDRVRSGECIDCMACTECCPTANAQLDLSEESRNVLVAGSLSCALIAGSYYLGNFAGEKLTAAAAPAAVSDTAQTVSGIAAGLPDGIYTGSGSGFRGETTVSVDVSGGIITNITVDSTNDNQEYMNRASSSVISEILSSQSADVDTVSGATYSSNAVITAVKNALGSGSSSSQTTAAASSQAETQAQTESASSAGGTLSAADGTYTGTGTGLRGETQVTVTVSGGKITDIAVDSYQDDQEFFERASAAIIDEILSEQSVDVDAVSGATYSSNGIRQAVADALNLDFTASAVTQSGHGGGHGGGR